MKLKLKKKYIIIVLLLIVLALLIKAGISLKNAFFPNESKIFYGTRLEGRDKVMITDAAKKLVKEKVSDKTSKCNVRVAGRIIYITMTAKDGVSRDDAKQLGNLALECFSEKEKEYYDIQIMIDHETNKGEFPIIGYKHHTKGAIKWTKDRTAE